MSDDESKETYPNYIDDPFKIDWKLVGKMCEAGADGSEIAARLGISAQHLYKKCYEENYIKFNEFKQSHKANGNLMLKYTQFKLAVEGNVPVLLFTLRSRLRQYDKPVVFIDGFSDMTFQEKSKAVMKLVDEEKITASDLLQMMQTLKIAFEIENGNQSIEKLEELERKHAI